MKKFIDKYHYLISLIIPIMFFISFFYFESRFYERLDFWMDRYRGRLKEDGVNTLQIDSIIDSSRQAGDLAFSYTQDIYFLFFFLTLFFIFAAFSKVKNLEKEIESLKAKLNV